MRIIKPYWTLHEDDKERPQTIYTIDVHPDGSRLATGGLDTKIKIWTTSPILNEKYEHHEKVPKLLSTMTSHSGAIMCLRWSSAGRYLASGSDDNIVMIWNLETGAGGKVWGSSESNIENWKATRRLVGHDSDVAGVAWSPDDYYLASVGLDSTVLIWSGHNFSLLRRLDNHLGFVKGVVFDPVGQYLATQSDDNTVKIWTTDNWQLHTTISEPFQNSPKTNQVRPTWSPEGTHLVTPNSMNGPVFVAAVIDRSTWKSNNSMVGHENIVEVAAFNPLIFLRDPKAPPNGPNLCTLLALAARSSISLWLTSQSQPIVVFDDVFDRDILDLSWSKDGTQLWSCSSEGHVAVFTFDLAEFGTVAPAGTKESYHTTYGYQKRPIRAPLSTLSNQPSSSLSGQPASGTVAQPNVLVSRKGPGAKRIVPVVAQVQSQPVASTSQLSSHHPHHHHHHQHQQLNAFQPPPVPPLGAPHLNRAAGGWGGNGVHELHPRKRKAPGPPLGPQQGGYVNYDDDDHADDDDGYYLPADRISTAPYRTAGRTLGDDRPRPPRPELRQLRPAYIPREKERTFAITNNEGGEGLGGGGEGRVKMLAVPEVVTFGELRVEDGEGKDRMEWRNFGAGDHEGTAEITVVTIKGKTLWVDYLPKYIVCAAGNEQLVAVSLEDGSLVVYSPTGRRLLPTLVLDSPCAFLEAEGSFLMAITALGSLTVWNTSLGKAIFPPLSVSSLLTASATRDVPHPTITTSALRHNGVPLLSLSSGSTHSYDSNLSAWTRISEVWWSKGSDFWEARRGKANASGRGVIRSIESAINDIIVDQKGGPDDDEPSSNSGEADGTATQGGSTTTTTTVPSGVPKTKVGNEEMFRSAVSLGHLEIKMKSAIALSSAEEYRSFLMMYARKLSDEGFRSKAEELVRELLGPIYFKPGKQDTWEPTIIGLSKRDLLKEVLAIFVKSRMIASLGLEYQETLKRMNA